jgi:peptide/nickel transport system permease protein
MKACLVAYLATLWVVLTLNFSLPRLLPGDPLRALLDPESLDYVFDAEVRAALEASYGLDQPLLGQYADYLKGAVTGDLSPSIRLNRPVGELLATHLPWMLLLTSTALGLAPLLGLRGGAEATWEHGLGTDPIPVMCQGEFVEGDPANRAVTRP